MEVLKRMAKYVDDTFESLDSDIDKMRVRYRQYISYSNEQGAKSVVDEIINNALDECKSPRSPGNKIWIDFDEKNGFIEVTDNGRGIPLDKLYKIYTTLNSGSNLHTENKASMHTDVAGQNGTGTLAICALAEHVEITSYRGGTENKWKRLIFEEGKKISEEDGKCSQEKHGMHIRYKPSKIMGKKTHIVWNDIHKELLNIQYLTKNKITIFSVYHKKDESTEENKYKPIPFENILDRNDKDKIISNKYLINISTDDIEEEVRGENVKRFLSMDIAFVYTSSLSPYIDSFSNSINTVDNGDHIDGAIEGLCRFLQTATKNSLGEKEKERLDIKWDDVKSGLSIAVALHSNIEALYTGQTKHKVVSELVKESVKDLMADQLPKYFEKNNSGLRELVNIVKMNAKARREGEKVKSAVVKNTLTNWSSYKMKNFDPCTNKGKEYKELFIIEGDSARGSLKLARDPRFQALFAIRGVSANAWNLSLDQIVGPKGNKEFTDLITVMGCNVGVKFDMNKLNYDKIVIASDADIDGYFIRSLLLSFYFKVFPEIIEDGRLYIAEPPLYRVDDKKNPFVINTNDYINRYVKEASKSYKLGYLDPKDKKKIDIKYLNKDQWFEFLSDTSNYVDDMKMLVDHYKVNSRLLEIILEEFTRINGDTPEETIDRLSIQHLMNRIGEEFPELYYDDQNHLIKGSIDAKWQMIELSEALVRRSTDVTDIMKKWLPEEGGSLILRDQKTNVEHEFSLLETLKVLKKFQPDILHRFKGLGENSPEDLNETIMDPNTRMLIKVEVGDITNDMKVFQVLRGRSPVDALNRKTMMAKFKISKDDIDT